MSWLKTNIRSISHGVYDGPHATPPPSDKGAIFLGITAISESGYIDEQHAKLISEDDLPRWTKRVTPTANDIVFSYEATLNLYARIPIGFHGCLGRRIGLIRPNAAKVDSLFLFYYFFSPRWRALIQEKTVRGATVDRISVEDFPNFEVIIPQSIAAQKKIASILFRYDALIENNRKQIKLLEEAAQRLYKEWFIDLRFPGHEHTPLVGGIPEGWGMVHLDDVAEITSGQSPKSEFYNKEGKGLPFHQGVGSYGFRFVIDCTYTSKYSKTAKANSILFSVRAPVGRLNFTKHKIAIGRGIAAINHKLEAQNFLFYQLKEHFFKDDIMGNGAIFSSIGGDELRQLPILLPAKEFIVRFEEIARRINKKIEVLDSQTDMLTEARDRLLPKLMSGEIAV